jgi:hypothetical protein
MRHISRIFLGVASVLALWSVAMSVQAQTPPNWKSLPMACLPERAIPWDPTKSAENQQYSCHCPPSSLCPADITRGNPPRNMPPRIAVRCCALPACPGGMEREENGVCAPEPSCTTCGGGDGGGGDGGDCIGTESPVALSSGKIVTIGTLKPGDSITGPNGEVVVGTVTHTEKKNPLFYSINDLAVVVTGEHPLLTSDGWKAIDPEGKYINPLKGRLEVGDVLVTQRGRVKVAKIELLPDAKSVKAVNIRTNDDKPFYVDGVAVKPFKDVEFTY